MNKATLTAKHAIKRLFGRFGLELRLTRSHHGPGSAARPLAVTNLFYEDVAARGFRPSFILDVGANRGDWTEMMLDIFPDADYLLLEPQHEMASRLDALESRHPNVTWHACAAGPEETTLELTVFDNLNGSSLVPDAAHAEGRERRSVPVHTIDGLVDGRIPDLVKLDVQGFELEALKGASSLFGHTEIFVLEASLFRFYEQTPLLHEVIAFMKERGYVPYDIADYIRRTHDGALAQIDMAFAREDGILRATNRW